MNMTNTKKKSGLISEPYNRAFSAYTQSSAFTLTLNFNAMRILVNMFQWELGILKRARKPWEYGFVIETKVQSDYLIRRGLIQFADVKSDENFCLTRMGIYTAKLLSGAGIQPTQHTDEASMDSLFDKYHLAADEFGQDIRNYAKGWGLLLAELPNMQEYNPPISIEEIIETSSPGNKHA